jgi:hypothetical protein
MNDEHEEVIPLEESAIGFSQDVSDGLVFEIENDSVIRRVEFAGGRLQTVSLLNATNCEEYLEECVAEFELELLGDLGGVAVGSRECELVGHQWTVWQTDMKRIRVDLRCPLGSGVLPVSVLYEARGRDEAVTKWLEVGPAPHHGWKLHRACLDNLRLKETVEGVRPINRRAVEAEDSHKPARFEYGVESHSVVSFWGCHEGLFFSTHSPTGSERFTAESGLEMWDCLDEDLSVKVTTGAAAVGGYYGSQEEGFRRYTSHIVGRMVGDSTRELDHLDNHLLSSHPQQRLTLPTGQGTALEWRQAMYLVTWEHPYSSVVSGWCVSASQDKHSAIFDLMAMIGHWGERAPIPDGASDEVKACARKLEEFRSSCLDLFAEYQHVLGYPDGSHVDGSAHFVGDRGLIVLINPTAAEKSVRVPLEEPELELDLENKYKLTDLTDLGGGKELGSFLPRKAPGISIPPMQVRYIGVSI